MTDITRDPDLDTETGIEGEGCNWGSGYERPSHTHIVQCPGFNHRHQFTLSSVPCDFVTDDDANASIAKSLNVSASDLRLAVEKSAIIESQTEGNGTVGIIANGLLLTKMEDGLHLINTSGKPIYIHNAVIG